MTEEELVQLEKQFDVEHGYTTRTADFINFLIGSIPDGFHRFYVQSGSFSSLEFTVTKLCGMAKAKSNPRKLAGILNFYLLTAATPSDCNLTIFTSKFDAMGQARREPPTICMYNVAGEVFNFSGESSKAHITSGFGPEHVYHRFNFVDAPEYPRVFDREKALAGIILD